MNALLIVNIIALISALISGAIILFLKQYISFNFYFLVVLIFALSGIVYGVSGIIMVLSK